MIDFQRGFTHRETLNPWFTPIGAKKIWMHASKSHPKKYVEATWIFRSAKLHRKGTWKWRGNSSKFGLRRIDVIPSSNRLEVPVGQPLYCKFNLRGSGSEWLGWMRCRPDACSSHFVIDASEEYLKSFSLYLNQELYPNNPWYFSIRFVSACDSFFSC